LEGGNPKRRGQDCCAEQQHGYVEHDMEHEMAHGTMCNTPMIRLHHVPVNAKLLGGILIIALTSHGRGKSMGCRIVSAVVAAALAVRHFCESEEPWNTQLIGGNS
jgi:hypothetical protein